MLFFTHICHPSLANDNTSGMAVATALAEWIAREPRRFTYRFVFAPGTIGSLAGSVATSPDSSASATAWCSGLLGDPGALTYKRTRREDREIEPSLAYVLAEDPPGKAIDFSPYGYDERQLCSPGFNLPVGRLTRSVNGGYPQYHTSADNLELIRPRRLARQPGCLPGAWSRSWRQSELCQSARPRASRASASADYMAPSGGANPASANMRCCGF